MDEQMDFIMKMDKLMGNKWEVNLKNDLITTN